MGATSGIGLALAERLAADGHRIGVAGRKTEVMRELQKRYPEQIVYSRIDVTDAEAPRKLHDLIERLGGMDVYFHIAGIGFSNEALETDRELLTMQTNVVGFTRMVDTAFRYFRDHGGRGHIGAISSVAGTKGIAQIAAYSASKTLPADISYGARTARTPAAAADTLHRHKAGMDPHPAARRRPELSYVDDIGLRRAAHTPRDGLRAPRGYGRLALADAHGGMAADSRRSVDSHANPYLHHSLRSPDTPQRDCRRSPSGAPGGSRTDCIAEGPRRETRRSYGRLYSKAKSLRHLKTFA